ncbi:hypothetical protein VVD49_02425 [Uliginosibacterium sp. H3]|uniref:Chondroitin AC lyase n=1 Tax=Uliginosibacterium silvisoli TaxID=3114758 RepID=A0ABU6JY15_9RHOO|nr:hypothetical protein [Uliginosibacterium sp. H3]
MRRIFVALFCVLSTFANAASWQVDEATRVRLIQSLDGRYARLFDHGELRKGQTSIDTAAFALDAVAVNYDAQKITQALNALVAMQDADATSRSYGNMHWYQGDQKLVDRNGVEFVMRRLALIPLLFPDRLNTVQSDALNKVMTLAKTGITKHDVRISYTNIFLMKTWNLIAMGEALKDDALATQGRSMLRDWLTYTARTGINEFLSPAYFEVDLDNLSLIANLSNDAATRQMANDGLAFFWHDIALHWYSPGMRLGGAHSRDYDRLFNVAALNTKMAETGWFGNGPIRRTTQGGPYEFYAWAQPLDAARQWLSETFPRFISERWGEEPEKRFAHYMGRNFGISSAESGYTAGHDNAPLVINMGGGADVPIIDFFVDGRRDHYGTNKTLETGSGHMKALHLKPFLSSVQNDGEVLFVASIQNDIVNNAVLESIITLPADAEMWLDDKPLKLFSASSKWNYDIAPNGDSTQIRIVENESEKSGRPEVLLSDKDDKLGVGLSRQFDVTPGKDYRIAASMQGGDVFLYLNFYDAERHLIGGEHAQKVSAGAIDFAERTYSYTAPPGAVSCKAWLYSTTGNKTSLRINDLRFEEMSKSGLVAKLLGGFDFREYKAEQVSVPIGATLTLRREDVAVALRLINAWNVQGRNVPFTLYNDGLQYHAMRLTAQHAEGGMAGRGSIAVWAYAEEGIGSDAAFEAFRRKAAAVSANSKLDGDQMDVSVRGITGSSRIVADVVTGRRILREGMKAVPADAVMWVNGRDVGREILRDHVRP